MSALLLALLRGCVRAALRPESTKRRAQARCRYASGSLAYVLLHVALRLALFVNKFGAAAISLAAQHHHRRAGAAE
eukprot:1809354-Pleurochrysis_carterae.AAC.2